MDTLTIYPAKLTGEVTIPPSKSISHRAIISAALAQGESVIENLVLSEDIKATLEGIKSFGADIKYLDSGTPGRACSVRIKGNPGSGAEKRSIDCGESGSTLRFLIPLACLGRGKNAPRQTMFTGRGKLVERPLDEYFKIFERQKIEYHSTGGGLPLTVKGDLRPGTFRVRGDVSSQFITGLMFVLPLLEKDSKIEITTGLQSKGYVELTLDVLEKFGIRILNKNFREFIIKGNQKYKGTRCRVEGDYSQAAFWITAGILGGGIKCKGLNLGSVQGDRAILDIISEMKAAFHAGRTDDGPQGGGGFIKVLPSDTCGTIIDASQCPDLVPVAAVLGALSSGITRIVNAGRLRIKESDRLRAVSEGLNRLGADVTELEDGLVIRGKESLRGGRVDSWNDHRIAMALAVASVKCAGPVVLTGSDAVNKSYPHFWSDFTGLGGKTGR